MGVKAHIYIYIYIYIEAEDELMEQLQRGQDPLKLLYPFKTLPRKNQVGKKTSGEGKRVKYSSEFLSAFRLPH